MGKKGKRKQSNMQRRKKRKPQPGTPDYLFSDEMTNLMDQTRKAYKAGNKDEFERLAAKVEAGGMSVQIKPNGELSFFTPWFTEDDL